MEQIIKANDGIIKILGRSKTDVSGYRMLHYCVPMDVEEGTLLFNLLTRELLLLTPEEYANALELPYLRKQWFVVPESTDERKLVGLIRWVQKSLEKKPKRINGYTILTTTDCNARCFYCYELGRSRVPMTEETASKTGDFIKDNCDGKPVWITWFGGEPLYNYRAIDIICDKLRAEGVEFHSFMISNGYLFNDELVEKATNHWNLNRVQITIDGTENVYNRCKAFIYRDGSAYQVVMNNIQRLLDKGIAVFVRMNIDFHNAEDLMDLADELAERFGGRKGFRAYSHLIFDDSTPYDQRYSMEKWEQLYEAKHRLELKLKNLGISSPKAVMLKRKLPQVQCMADDPRSIVILPDGHLGVCEHFSETEMIGHMDSPERDQAVIDSFRQYCDELPECATCFYYPECIRLKKCPDLMPCIPPERASIRWRTQCAMVNEYQLWQKGDTTEGTENNELC